MVVRGWGRSGFVRVATRCFRVHRVSTGWPFRSSARGHSRLVGVWLTMVRVVSFFHITRSRYAFALCSPHPYPCLGRIGMSVSGFSGSELVGDADTAKPGAEQIPVRAGDAWGEGDDWKSWLFVGVMLRRSWPPRAQCICRASTVPLLVGLSFKVMRQLLVFIWCGCAHQRSGYIGGDDH